MSDKIIFMGTPNFSVPTLRSLFNSNYKIEAVFTQPPKKKIKRTKNNKISGSSRVNQT